MFGEWHWTQMDDSGFFGRDKSIRFKDARNGVLCGRWE